MKRFIFYFLVGFVLLLCASSWILSRFHSVQVAYWGRRERIIVLLDRGNVLCELTHGDLEEENFPPTRRWFWDSELPGNFGELDDWVDAAAWYHRFGFAAAWSKPEQYPISESKAVSATTSALGVPLWLPLLLGSILTLMLYRRDRQLRVRRRLGRCPACGYDLRATLDRCPECGMVQKANANRNRQ